MLKDKLEELKAKLINVTATSDMIKLTLNGTFGKFGNKYSKIYSPDLMLQVTLTGQLLLLMLIEQLELNGFEVVSANTDGIEYICSDEDHDKAKTIICDWELETGMNMEHNAYEALYARDVNNYVAVYKDHVKSKGAYKDIDLWKNIEYPIVYSAIKKYLFSGDNMFETIKNCKDVREFVIIKRVNGGGEWCKQYLGKVVRWYYSTDGAPITYVKNGNKVGKSDDAKPLMTFSDGYKIPKDLDYEKYNQLAIKHINDLGVNYVI